MAFLHDYQGSSFVTLLQTSHPELLPRLDGAAAATTGLVRATTICALCYRDGVLIGGDRRATLDGHVIMHEEVTKVFQVDEYSAIAIAGTFGPSIKMVRLFQVELEHYEKIEGLPLSLDGKANKLSLMLEANFPLAVQGLVVMPLYVGYDRDERRGKIFEFDITGGIFTQTVREPYSATGSGGDRARSTFEHFYRDDLDRDQAVALMEKALAFAAKRDTATGGRNFIVLAVEAEGVVVLRGEASRTDPAAPAEGA
jgi:proteasome beta subunit